MNYKKQSIGIVLAVAMASLLIAGTILAPTQASAGSQRKSSPQFNNFNDNTNDNTNTAKSRSNSGGFTDTASLKHAIRDGVTVNLQHRDQHMDQENLCYRANTCRQSSVGQETLGNDNSVTGFADQSDNIPQAAAAPTPVTPTNQTTANQTSANTTTTPGGTTINNFINNSTTLFSLCSSFTIVNSSGTGGAVTGGAVTCTIAITNSPGAFVGVQTIPSTNIIPRPTTGCPPGSVEGIVTLPGGSTLAVCVRL
jgi:hypothetical protein